MVQKLKVKNSVSYGSGQYDRQAHEGSGRPHAGFAKTQKALSPAAGEGRNSSTPNANNQPVRDGVEGKGDKKRGYQTDAHSGSYHGKNGEAVGHKSDLHMQYDKELYSEGREYAPEGKNPGHIMTTSQSKATKAAHHPPVSNVPHRFDRQPSRESHGFGYGNSQKSGHLRMSGHSHAHLLGKK